jgi:uncharacterized membrane protein YhaH (DUF805 family)
MTLLPSFHGSISRRAYLIGSLVPLVAQYLVHILAYNFAPLDPGWGFPVIVFSSPAISAAFSFLPGGFAAAKPTLTLLAILDISVAWSLLALAIRRARSTDRSMISACLVSVPVIQIFTIFWLGEEPLPITENAYGPTPHVSINTALKGLLVGLTVTVVLEVVSTLVFRTYGFFLFFASPFIVGCITGYIGNRRTDIGPGATAKLVIGACFLGAVGLLAIAVEGVLCLALAAPLIALIAWLGGIVGRTIAVHGPGATPRRTALSMVVLPLFFAIDVIAPPHVAFESTENIEVAASDRAVWDAIVHMGPIPSPPAAPFRWGLAYPMSGSIHGAGIGAIREGVFSTGVAYERVTEWQPPRRLSFIVLTDPPTMRELSPYQDVHAPHVNGYFRTVDARFTIAPLANGHTLLTLDTRHELKLNPYLYWLPIAKWAIHTNKTRVLRHFAQQAEGSAAAEPEQAARD